MLANGNWLVVGSGPSGRDLDPKMFANQTVVAVNTAAERIGEDNWSYWVRIVNPRHGGRKLEVRCPGGVEVQIHSEFKSDHKIEPFVQGSYTPWCDPIGAAAVQWACNHGASDVRVYGFEGIIDRKTTVLGAADPFGHYSMQRDRVQSCISAYPEVGFVFYGRMCYELTGNNVSYDEPLYEKPPPRR